MSAKPKSTSTTGVHLTTKDFIDKTLPHLPPGCSRSGHPSRSRSIWEKAAIVAVWLPLIDAIAAKP